MRMLYFGLFDPYIVLLQTNYHGVFGYTFQLCKIDSEQFLCYLVVYSQNQFLHLELILEEVKKFYFLSELLLEELSNINHFISKLILVKSIPTKSILSRINFTKVELNTY